MATEMTSSNLSPKAAFTRIWKRLTDAVSECKKKAGVSAQTESIMEAANGDDSEMIDLGEDNLFGDPEQGMIDLGEDNLFGAPGDTGPEPPASAESAPEGDAPAGQPATVGTNVKGGAPGGSLDLGFVRGRAKRLTKAEREEEERLAKERQRQLDKENNYSSKEIWENWKSLFDYAYKNREYLKDAGQLITEDEVRTLFTTEYNNYIAHDHGETTTTVLNGILGIFRKKLPTIIKWIDDRLHGEGNFMENGSLVGYLYRAATEAYVVRTPIPRAGETLGIKSKTVVNGNTSVLNQFVLVSDLRDCEDWIRDRFRWYDVPSDAIKGMALDILANGTNKTKIVERLGGRKDIPKRFAIPKYGTLERSGNDVMVLGPRKLVTDFNSMFDQYMDESDKSSEHLGAEIRPVNAIGANKFHGGIYGAAYDEAKYLDAINNLVREGALLPIAFDVGKISTDRSGGGSEGYAENRWGDNLMSHRDDGNGMSTITANFGEQLSANGLMQLLDGDGAQRVAEMSGSETLLSDARKSGDELGALSKFSSAVMQWLCDELDREYTVKNASGISAVIFDNEPSIIAEAGKNMSLDRSTRAVLRANEIFNGAMARHIKDSDTGGDIGDIPHMSPEEIRKKAMPDIHLDELARKCYDVLESGDQSDSVVTFGKGYLVYMMHGMFNIPANTPSLIADISQFGRVMETGRMNVGQIRQYIQKMGAEDVASMARRLEYAAPDIMVGQEGGHIMYGEMYPDCNMPMDKLAPGILGALAYISDMDPAKCICDCAEALCGMEPGSLSEYMDDLETCDDKIAIEARARDINNNGRGIVDLHMSDAGKERVVRVKPASMARPKPAAPAIARYGRNRF